MKLIGLTGIMGAGKSSVIDILGQMDIMVLDCDQINASLIAKAGGAYERVVACFGKGILDSEQNIDPKKLSALIFQDSTKKQQVEGILHPMIQAEIRKEIQAHSERAIIVVEVPLLFEVKWESFFDEVWVVASREDLLFERLKKYRHISEEEARRRLAYQMPQEEKLKKADVVLMNDRDIPYLRMQIEKELKRWKGSEGFVEK